MPDSLHAQLKEKINELAESKFADTGFVLITVDMTTAQSVPQLVSNLEPESMAQIFEAFAEELRSNNFGESDSGGTA